MKDKIESHLVSLLNFLKYKKWQWLWCCGGSKYIYMTSWFIRTSSKSNPSKHETGWGLRLGHRSKPDKLQIFGKSVSGIRRNPGARKSGNLGCVGKCDTRRPVSRWGLDTPRREGSSSGWEMVRRKSSCNNWANIFYYLNKYISKFGQVHFCNLHSGHLILPPWRAQAESFIVDICILI